METLGQRIRVERARRGWRQADLAFRVGLSCAAVCAIERNQSNPKATHLLAIAMAFDVSTDYLLGWKAGSGSSQPEGRT